MDHFDDFTDLIEKNQFVPMRELIFQYLREAIVTSRLMPDDHLVEEELAKKLNVSRTPIREAIRKLELEGLVKHSPRRGVIVRKFSTKDAEEIYDLRAVLEGYAASLAAQHIEEKELSKLKALLEVMKEDINKGESFSEMDHHKEWHLALYAASKNQRLEQLLNDYADYLRIFRIISLKLPGRLNETWEEHDRLLKAIELGDGELAERRAREHAARSKEAFLKEWPMLSNHGGDTE
ncbi:GntR family transcriptional regulator [Candidatus Formimonas warabiya]|uniref:HTH gntR-type domain-containing protein n=1 Tax=Formimonas warabiya TaxID=1761012 RepID=A0A3G1KXM5_FORW1|nr:GntR family transcriptional regulator [Candidatus Formimonas warabiya]ATW27170.1 hypothetical protein DCMF_22625 [Candidatus Formimonas warabiya]